VKNNICQPQQEIFTSEKTIKTKTNKALTIIISKIHNLAWYLKIKPNKCLAKKLEKELAKSKKSKRLNLKVKTVKVSQ